jgi:hypothetical protein
MDTCLRVFLGRAIAQAVSRPLPTAATRVRAQVIICGICGGQSETWAGFLRVLRFLLPIRISSVAPHSSSIVRDWYNRPVSGRRAEWTQFGLHPPLCELKKIKLILCMKVHQLFTSEGRHDFTQHVLLRHPLQHR